MYAKVSVITATWGRPARVLAQAIPSVLAQDYAGAIEHLVVSDGPDPELAEKVAAVAPAPGGPPRSCRCVQLGRNWHGLTGGQSWGAVPRAVGTCLAAGDYIAYLDDDNRYRPHHVRRLVELLEREGADFAYGKFYSHRHGVEVGGAPPRLGNVDTSALLHAAALLGRPDCQWRAAGYASDADVVDRWLAAGATFAFLDEVTFDYDVA